MGFAEKYNASPFDPNDPRDVRSEKARRVLVRAFIDSGLHTDASTGEDVQDIAAGLLVGLAGVVMAHSDQSDDNHASIRAGLIQIVPWAVDMVRAVDDLPPLSEA